VVTVLVLAVVVHVMVLWLSWLWFLALALLDAFDGGAGSCTEDFTLPHIVHLESGGLRVDFQTPGGLQVDFGWL